MVKYGMANDDPFPSNVVLFPGYTRLDLSPDEVLMESMTIDLADVLVIGFDVNGVLYVASTQSKMKDLLYALKLAEWELLHDLMSGNTEELDD